MAIESGLAQQASVFADSMQIKPAPSVERTADETGQDLKAPLQGDKISISKEARALAATDNSENPQWDEGQDNPFGLTPEEQKRANELFDELDTLFTSGKELTSAQEERVDAIFDELDELFPVEEEFNLTAEEEKQLDALFAKLDELYENEHLTPEQEKQAEGLEQQIDSIFMAAEMREEGETEDSAAGVGVAGPREGADTTKELTIKMLKERIEKLEQEIKELEEGDLPEKQKLQKLQDKEVQLQELRDQLLKAQQEQLKTQGMAEGGGTRANGFGNSVSSF